MIPKVIHYCWFGNNTISEKGRKCIDSWKKFFPDYEIKQWDESNFDLHISKYVEEAYANKKWAFVSDYARVWILYNYGGIYFDTDVEVINSVYDILEKGPYMGTELDNEIAVNLGLGVAVEPYNALYKEFLDYYDIQSFIKNDGSINTETIVNRITNILIGHGYKRSNKIECIEGIYIYPPDYFCPKDYYTGKINLTDNSRTIHHYSASWHEPEEELFYLKQQKIIRVLGRKFGKIIYTPLYYFYRFKMRRRQLGSTHKAVLWFLRKIRLFVHICG